MPRLRVLKRWGAAFALLAAIAVHQAFAAPNFPAGTFVVLGNAKNWKNASYDATDAVTIRAVATNGTILAETVVGDSTDGRNFALQIPLSTLPSEKTVNVGDQVRLWSVYGQQLGVASDLLTIGAANSHTNVTLMVQEVEKFTTTNQMWSTGYPDMKLPVAKAYLDELQPWLVAYGLSFTPDDDWDRDGRSNYMEYLAGTHPLDSTDFLSISSLDFVRITDFNTNMASNAMSSRVAVTFECVNGHTYVIPSATDLAEKNWVNKSVMTDLKADPASATQEYTAVGKEDGDTVTLYMVPATEAKREFFTVQPK